MMGRLLRAELLVLKPWVPVLCAAFLLYGIPMYRFGQYISVIIVYALGVFFLLLGVEERSGAYTLFRSLPLQRKRIVTTKYVNALLCLVAVYGLGVLGAPLYELMFRWNFQTFRGLIHPRTLVTILAAYLVVLAAYLPVILYKGIGFGMAVGTLIMVILLGGAALLVSGLRPETRSIAAADIMASTVGQTLTLVICLALYAGSYALAQVLFKRRSFSMVL